MKKVNTSIIDAVNETKADLVKPKRKYTKRKSTYNEVGVNTTNSFNTPPKKARKPYTKRVKAVSPIDLAITKDYVKGLEAKLDEKTRRLNALEQCLIEKEKEVWKRYKI
jgi:vacuolar-type H+-ATPase subunit D/Vma8